MDTTPEAIFRELKRIAPDIAFSVSWAEDPDYKWDGDGPDPRDHGYLFYDVDVSAKAIIHGEEYEGHEYLGGVDGTHDEQDLDVHGYLPQMLHGAVGDLLKDLPDSMSQAQAAMRYMEEILQVRYHQQERPRKKQAWSPRAPGKPKK
jgi:hypothetical protein